MKKNKQLSSLYPNDETYKNDYSSKFSGSACVSGAPRPKFPVPKKSMGQNFLTDNDIAENIVDLVTTSNKNTCGNILELGAGTGALTRVLLEKTSSNIVAVEKDERCIKTLEKLQKTYTNRLTIVPEDMLKLDLESMFQEEHFQLVSNLPYNISTKIFLKLLLAESWPPKWENMVLMFQEEVALRITSPPHNPSYGRLSVIAQWRSKINKEIDVPPNSFFPAPKVQSTVLKIIPINHPTDSASIPSLLKVLNSAFSCRRKKITNNLKSLFPNVTETLKSMNINPSSRAENLSIEEYCAIARALHKNLATNDAIQ